jgi:capsid assembly protease
MLVDQSARVWAMRRDDVMASQALQFRAAVANGEVEAFGLGDRLEGSDFARVVDGVAIIPVKGPLMRAFSYWMWSYEEIGRDLQLAQASNLVRAIVLDIDSPGGLVAGCGDLAAAISTSGPKPVESFVGGMAASAAYWLASSATRVRVGSGAILGSIGSVIEYVDFEPMLEKMGAKMVRVVAEQSPNKRLDPHGPEGQAEMQALVDAAGAEFVAGVAAARGVTVVEVMDRFGQGLVFDGMEAIVRGMADDRTTLEEMVAELAGRDQIVIAAPAAAAQETPMDWASIDLAALQQHRPELVTAIEAAAGTAASAAERERILGLDEVSIEGFEELVAAAKADGKTTPAELALQIVRADKKAGSNHLAQRAASEITASVAPVQPQVTTSVDVSAPLEQRAKAQWDKDAELRAEFGDDFATFLAFEKANASGSARIMRAS